MAANRPQGSFKLVRLFGIDVYVHWLWFLLLVYEVRGRGGYGSLAWNLAEFLSLFVIVLMHEFGHALACRSVGGEARFIMLWLLGGVAYVKPPMRPGAVLWSLAAGPLVNVVLMPILVVTAYLASVHLNQGSDLRHYLIALAFINGILLVFNLLPIYPLDGGQILQSILWFFVGFTKSLRFVAGFGVLAAAGLAALLIVMAIKVGSARSLPLGLVMAGFIGWQAYNGYSYARRLAAQGVDPTTT
ncbi:MAG: site-2 protease family protein [Phycisphaeraceae bacterium]|nr:site-2 protease family protein [Phycisphaeraceae bacterium]